MQGSIRQVDGKIYLEEVGPEHTSVRYQLKEILYSRKSPYQLVEVADSYDYGRMLILDGCVNVCERDEANYHEMIAHIPALLHPNPERVLVIGGGDGGTVRELLKHNSIRTIDVVEIDEEVIAACKKYFPSIASSFDDPRVNLHCEDGAGFVQRASRLSYSIIIVDSSDPIGPAEGLFSRDFYGTCRDIIDKNGIVVAQSESPYIFARVLREVYRLYANLFKAVLPYRVMVPTYPSGQIYFMLGSKMNVLSKTTARHKAEKFFARTALELKYLNREMFETVFVIPEDVKNVIMDNTYESRS